MRGLRTLLRRAGSLGLLVAIVLCQSVIAHNDGRRVPARKPKPEPFIRHYQLVKVQKVSRDVSEYTYRAWLANPGGPLAGATATLVSAPRGLTVVDGSVSFGAIAAGRTAVSLDTFSVRQSRHRFIAWWPEFRWRIVPAGAGGANRAPVANAGADRSGAVGARVTLDGSASADPDGDSLRYSWTLDRPVGSSATLTSPSSRTPSFVPDRRGTYEAHLIVDDGVLPSAPDSVVVSVSNTPPVADAGANQTARVTQVVTLDGSGSSDPDGDGLEYQWTLTARPSGSGAALSSASDVSPTFVVDRPGSYTAQLVVHDGGTASAADTVTVTTVNSAPVASAGADQTAPVGATVALNGSASSDVDGDALRYAWTVQSLPAGSHAALAAAASMTPSLTLDRAGSYVLRLVVDDGQAASAADTVTISTVNSAPVAAAGSDQTALVNQTVTLDGGGSSDVDGDALTFSWAFVSRPAGSTAVLTGATSVQPSFDVDRSGRYRVRLIVNDGTLSSVADVVDIETLNSAPVANAGPDQSSYVGRTVTLDGSGSTDVDGNTLSYVWALISRPSGSSASIANPAALTPSFALDRAGVYVAQLIVNDGTVSSAADTVTVTTLNSAPVANAGADRSIVVGRGVVLAGDASSDPDGDPLLFSWALIQRPTGSRAALAVSPVGLAQFTADRPGVYIAQLIVNDGRVDSAPDTVTITTGNTAPVADAGPDQVDVPAGSVVALDGGGSADADGHALTYRWSLLSQPAGSGASLSDVNAQAPFFQADHAGQYVAQLIVNDGFVDSAPDTVVVTVPNRAPVADAGTDQSLFVGAVAGLSGVASSDPDGDPLTYQWAFVSRPSGSAAVLSGASSVAASFTPDRAGSYTVSLTVADPMGESATATVVVSAVTPVTVTVRAADATASESGDAGVLTFTRTGSTASALVVTYQVSGTATSGADYTPLSGSVTIPAGQSSATASVRAVNDSEVEATETVEVTLLPSGGYIVGTPGNAIVTIADNDR